MIVFDSIDRKGFSEYCPFTLDGEFTYSQLRVLDDLGYTIYDYERRKRLGVPSGIMSSGYLGSIGADFDGEMKRSRGDYRDLIRALLTAWGLEFEERELCSICESSEEEKTCGHGLLKP